MSLYLLSVLLATVSLMASASEIVNDHPGYHFSHPTAVHMPLKANFHLDTRPRHVERNGHVMTVIDAAIAGCPSLDFSATVTIGGKSFQLIVDTGSTTLAVASTACQSSGCGGVTSFYSPAATLRGGSGAFSSQYGDGSSWTGDAVSDSVSVGSSSAVSTILASITSQNGFFQSASCGFGSGPLPNQGIIGFAGTGLAVSSSNGRLTSDAWLAKYVSAHPSTANLFTLRMCLTSGDLWIGGYDASTFTDRLHWAQIISYSGLSAATGYWTVQVKSIGVSGGSTDSSSSDFNGNVNSLVDSGTTVALLPTTVYNNIVSALASSSFQNYFGTDAGSFLSGGNCNAVSTAPSTMNAHLPSVTVKLGAPSGSSDVTISLHGVNFYVQAVPLNGQTYYCPGIQDNQGAADVILGWSFINQLIVSHDVANARIGFAPRSSTGCSDGSPVAISVSGGYTGSDSFGSGAAGR